MTRGAHQASNMSSNMTFSVLLSYGNNSIDNSRDGTILIKIITLYSIIFYVESKQTIN